MANKGGTPGVFDGRGRTVGRIDYKLQKEKDRGTNEQSIADFSQSAHLEKSRQRSRNRQKKNFKKSRARSESSSAVSGAANGHFCLLRSQSLTPCAALFRLFLLSRFRDSLLRPAQLRISDNGPKMTAENSCSYMRFRIWDLVSL